MKSIFNVRHVTRTMLTEGDNETFDITRIMLLIGIIAYIALTIYSMNKGGTFDAMDWAIGYASILGGGGVAIGVKGGVERKYTPIKGDKDGDKPYSRIGDE